MIKYLSGILAALALLAQPAFAARHGMAGQAVAQPPPVGNTAVVFIMVGQSNGVVNDTNGIEPPLYPTGSTLYGPPYSASFTASFSTSNLGSKTFWSAYSTISTRSPTSGSGTMTVSAIASGNVYPGEVVTCTGVNGGSPFLITSDGFGTGSNGHTGTYTVNIQSSVSNASCTGAEPDLGGGGSFLSGFNIYDCSTSQFEPYNPVVGPSQNSAPCGANGSGAVGTPYWGPEGGFASYYLSTHANTTIYFIKTNISGTAICPNGATSDYWDAAFQGSDLLQGANKDVQGGYAALAALGVTNYTVGGILYIQGENDSQDNLNFGCNAYGSSNNVYKDNWVNLIDTLSIPTAQNFTATGSISGDVLTVTGTPGGTIYAGELLSGTGLPTINTLTSTLILPLGSTCLNGSGTPVTTTGSGAAGNYCIQVEQYIKAPSGTLTDSTSGATVASTAWRLSGISARIDATTGTISAGDAISGGGLLSGSYISKAYDYPSDGTGCSGCGNVGVNVSLSISSETLTFTGYGWGAGAGTGSGIHSGKVVVSEIQLTAQANNQEADGPAKAQEALSGTTVGGMGVTTIQRWDLPRNSLHVRPAAIMEEGRRMAKGMSGTCDYTSATC